MKHLNKILTSIQIHPLTVFYFIMSYLTDNLFQYASLYAIVCFHELCHLVMAYSFGFHILYIKLLPFGAYLCLDDYGYKSIILELIVALAGPCSHLFIYFIIQNCYFDETLLAMNSLIFSLNLLPIYPMDGYRIILLIMEKFLDLKLSLNIMNKISFISLCYFLSCCFYISNYVFFLYLLYQNIVNYYNTENYLRNYFLKIPFVYKEDKNIIHNKYHYIRDLNNYYLIKNKVYSEEQMKYTLIRNTKR